MCPFDVRDTPVAAMHWMARNSDVARFMVATATPSARDGCRSCRSAAPAGPGPDDITFPASTAGPRQPTIGRGIGPDPLPESGGGNDAGAPGGLIAEVGCWHFVNKNAAQRSTALFELAAWSVGQYSG